MEELKTYFSQYGILSDVYIPKPYRGFGFVTYLDGFDAQSMSKSVHTIRGHRLNVSVAEPKMGIKSSPREMDYRSSSSMSAYQTTPAQVYAYSLLQQPSSTHATAYVPATQYYAYQTDSSGRPQQYTTSDHQQHYSSYQTSNNRFYK